MQQLQHEANTAGALEYRCEGLQQDKQQLTQQLQQLKGNAFSENSLDDQACLSASQHQVSMTLVNLSLAYTFVFQPCEISLFLDTVLLRLINNLEFGVICCKFAAGNIAQMQASLHQERLQRQDQAALSAKLDTDKQQMQHRCTELEAKLRVLEHTRCCDRMQPWRTECIDARNVHTGGRDASRRSRGGAI